MASTYLTQTFGQAPTSNKIGTVSYWCKRSLLSSNQYAGLTWHDAGSSYGTYWNTSDQIDLWFYYPGSGADYEGELKTNAKYRDINGWYHILFAWDTTQATNTNRLKLYVNGEQITDLATATYPDQNQVVGIGGQTQHRICANSDNANTPWDGLMSHVYYVDGTMMTASDFGSTDATTGEWKINTSPTISSYGNNGFLILKDGNTITDQSPNSNNWTLTGTLTNTEDNPSNVFCTYNPLQQTNGSATFSNGNTYFASGTNWIGTNGTIAASEGKYYAEFKVGGTTGFGIGIADISDTIGSNNTKKLSTGNDGYQSKYVGGKHIFLNGSTIIAHANNTTVFDNAAMGNTSFASGDIASVALDIDNGLVFFGKNGTWLKSATESEIEAGTDTNATFKAGQTGTAIAGNTWTWSVTCENTNIYMNAGNGYFGTTAISSAGTNASGIGIFEYDVPDGFTALSTKGLNE